METSGVNNMSLTQSQRPFPLWPTSKNFIQGPPMEIISERPENQFRPPLSAYKKKQLCAFITVSLKGNKKRRPLKSMVTTEHVDPSIVALGQVVGFVPTANESKPAGYSFHNSFQTAYSDQQLGYAQGNTLKQPTLQFFTGIKVVKAAHSESKKANGWVLNPNSPTFVSRLTPEQYSFSAVSETKIPVQTTVPDNENQKTETWNDFKVISESPDKFVEYMERSPYSETKKTESTDENKNALNSIQAMRISNERSPNYAGNEKPRSSNTELVSEKVSPRYVLDVSHEEMESQRFNGYLKHPLQTYWSFWYFRNERNKNWIDNQVQIGAIGSVEIFWATYNSLEPASSLRFGCDYAFFRNDIRPMWEDKGNCNGGRWIFTLDKHKRSELDSLWEELLFALLGNKFGEHQDEICGAVINLREKGDKLAIWTANADKEDVQKAIGKMFKAKLKVPNDILIRYEAHSDNNTRRSMPPKARYQI